MRQIIVGAFVSLDGVMQAPGGPQEDPSGGFRFGGWTVPYWDETSGAAIDETFSRPFDLLLGRRTYDIFAGYWPKIETDPQASDYHEGQAQIARAFNKATKYVATHSPDTLTWDRSEALGNDVAGRLRELKAGDGPDLIVQGSSELVHQLLAQDLVDQLRLLTFPLVLGRGKRLFADDALPAALKLAGSKTSPSGVLIANYERGGEVTTGSF